MKERLIALLKQKSTIAGIAGLLVALIGLETGSTEQISTLIGSVLAIAFPEKPKA